MSASYEAGKRGRHKHVNSPETRRWVRDHMLPVRPPWMPPETYRELARLRGNL